MRSVFIALTSLMILVASTAQPQTDEQTCSAEFLASIDETLPDFIEMGAEETLIETIERVYGCVADGDGGLQALFPTDVYIVKDADSLDDSGLDKLGSISEVVIGNQGREVSVMATLDDQSGLMTQSFDLARGAFVSIDAARVIVSSFPEEMSTIDQRRVDVLPVFSNSSQIKDISLNSDGPSWIAAVLMPQRRLAVEFTSVPDEASILFEQQNVGSTMMGIIIASEALHHVTLAAPGYKTCKFGDGQFTRSNFGRSAIFHCNLVAAGD